MDLFYYSKFLYADDGFGNVISLNIEQQWQIVHFYLHDMDYIQ